MTTYDNELRGVLFANRDRKTEKHPNAKGEITIDGKEYWLAAWTQTSKNGMKYQSLKAEPKEESRKTTSDQRGDFGADDGLEGSIPF